MQKSNHTLSLIRYYTPFTEGKNNMSLPGRLCFYNSNQTYNILFCVRSKFFNSYFLVKSHCPEVFKRKIYVFISMMLKHPVMMMYLFGH